MSSSPSPSYFEFISKKNNSSISIFYSHHRMIILRTYHHHQIHLYQNQLMKITLTPSPSVITSWILGKYINLWYSRNSIFCPQNLLHYQAIKGLLYVCLLPLLYYLFVVESVDSSISTQISLTIRKKNYLITKTRIIEE
jgi:hypothetical protein